MYLLSVPLTLSCITTFLSFTHSFHLLHLSVGHTCMYFMILVGSWPKVVITMDSASSERPFTTSHYPPLPNGQCVAMDRTKLSLEVLVSSCVHIRSSALLHELHAVLHGTVWEGRG